MTNTKTSTTDAIVDDKLRNAVRWAQVSATQPDWTREKASRYWEPGKRLIATIRAYQYWGERKGAVAWCMQKLAVIRHRYWSVITGADIPLNTSIGGGLVLPHPNGIVIHPQSVIGVNCLLFQQVTLGKGGKKSGAPRLGGHVDVGAGAKILGGVRIGNCVKIGANAVVLDDVPDNCTAIGIPARVIPHSFSHAPVSDESQHESSSPIIASSMEDPKK